MIHDATDGIPRLINQLCDYSLVHAAANGIRTIDGGIVSTAWSEIQQLPTPWFVSKENEELASNVIEFGELTPSGKKSTETELDPFMEVLSEPESLQDEPKFENHFESQAETQQENQRFEVESSETLHRRKLTLRQNPGLRQTLSLSPIRFLLLMMSRQLIARFIRSVSIRSNQNNIRYGDRRRTRIRRIQGSWFNRIAGFDLN